MSKILAKIILAKVALALLLSSTAIPAVVIADKSPYQKFYRKEYSNKGIPKEEDELKLGEAMHKALIKQMRLVTDPVVNAYVSQIGMKLAQQSARPNLRYQFFVVEDQSVNAFATMGGYVYVNSGLLLNITNEAQLAAVMGHEIGHIAARHGLRKAKDSIKWKVIGGIVGAVNPFPGQIQGELTRTAGKLIVNGTVMKHSRDAENEADYLGLTNIHRTGYNTRGMIEMLQTLQELDKGEKNLLGDIMRSHPPAKDRVEKVRKEIATTLIGSDQKGTMGKSGAEFDKLRQRANGVIVPEEKKTPVSKTKRTGSRRKKP